MQLAADGTRKMVSVLTSGEGVGKRVETVIIPMLKWVRYIYSKINAAVRDVLAYAWFDSTPFGVRSLRRAAKKNSVSSQSKNAIYRQ